MNKNTIEDFKNSDKADLLNSFGKEIWSLVTSKKWITSPSCLLNFFVLTHADLKKFHFYYWFGFPCPSKPVVYVKGNTEPITTIFSNKQLEQLEKGFKSLEVEQKYFFVITKDNDCVTVDPLSKILDASKLIQCKDDINISVTYFAFADPSNVLNPAWPLRLFIAALLNHCPSLCGADINVVGLRCTNENVDSSQVYRISIPQDEQKVEVNTGWVGWERTDKGTFGPRLANMSASMDPIKLADTMSDLNIKLMKWRLAPDIDVDVMKSTKCLLLGAGTLGCHVARDLLAWGFRHITFMDHGKVSYSNPTRQVLFTHRDCFDGGRNKAEAAAENLKCILPTVKSRGICGHIGMPGFPVGESLMDEFKYNLKLLTEAIVEHDVIFLLLDSREARWLPTLLGAVHKKIVINAALGFDSYLVMRHGVHLKSSEFAESVNDRYIPGGKLGCYFCNDVTAPGNSFKDRTLDQQCTVTRPGVAAIAGALAVEMLVGLLQHPLRVEAPAVCNLNENVDELPELQGVLGPIPHSIRGFLHSYQTIMPTCAKFKQCIACSDVVIHRYKEEGAEFLIKVFESGKYLEEVTGLNDLHSAAEMIDLLTLSDEDQE
ncbi:ubiquitin-like modifier-activating enzyme ATG7 isoform X2 [Battus philenor]